MGAPIVRVEGVSKTFKGTIKALSDVSLEFEPGIVYGLLGPNGAGKTTLIRVLTTLLMPDTGKATVAGIDVVADPVTARTKIGLAGQFAAVDAYLTGRENIEMVARLYNLPRAEARRRTDELLERIHLTDAADRQVRTYSGGMRRRLDVAASMVGRPQVLFLDEPTTGIDPRSRVDLWDLIEELVAEGTTILLTTQYLEEADHLADQIAVIDHGRLVTQGTADELKDKLGGAVVALKVADHEREPIRQLLGTLSDAVIFDEARDELTIPAVEGSSTLTAVVRLLDSASIVPHDIALRKPTLDEVFMALTGHPAEEEVTSEVAPGGPRSRRGS
jgi:daunorubicin resistance ABC transporter ATP-binding subunit